MKSITIEADGNMRQAEEAARAAIHDASGELTLVSWYDAIKGTGGPLEVCGGESAKCVKDYATSHEAAYHVKVNGGDYELYFTQFQVT